MHSAGQNSQSVKSMTKNFGQRFKKSVRQTPSNRSRTHSAATNGTGLYCLQKKVLKLLREIDPHYASPEKNAFSDFVWRRCRTNLLNRKFSPPRPNMAWLGDITDIKTDAGTCCLCAILDLFSRRIVAAHLDTQKNAGLVCHTFQDAFAARGAPKDLLFHSDQGGRYTGCQFRNLLYSNGVTQSFSAPGVPYDNAPMESFFASLKVEEIHRYRYHGISDLAASLKEYFVFYNHKRSHSSIGNQTPVQAEKIYFKNKTQSAFLPTAFL